ncbi:uncharacterized protein LOC143288960 [Babylonia areolata]|uniref:uncharacterized protein LOC143288960 n=1 Tax=Babylonia areolata TaxID=304850 RepID=UPI003FD61A2F
MDTDSGLTVDTEPRDDHDGDGDKKRQNKNEKKNKADSVSIKTEPMDMEYERHSESSEVNQSCRSDRTDPVVVKFEPEEEDRGIRTGRENESEATSEDGDKTSVKHIDLSSMVVRLQRLDEDIVSALMPGSHTASPDPLADSHSVDVKTEPVFFEENFCGRSDDSCGNRRKRKRQESMETGTRGSAVMKHKEVELIKVECPDKPAHPVWVKTSQGDIICCFPLRPPAPTDHSVQLHSIAAKAALLQKPQACLHGSSFPKFSGYVPSGHTGKPDRQKSRLPKRQQASHYSTGSKPPTRRRPKPSTSVDSSSEDSDSFSSCEDKMGAANNSTEDEVYPVLNAAELPGPLPKLPFSHSPAVTPQSLSAISGDWSLNSQKHAPRNETMIPGAPADGRKAFENSGSGHSTIEIVGSGGETDDMCQTEGASSRNGVQQLGGSSSRSVVYPDCQCMFPSWFEKEEATLWRSVVLASQNCMVSSMDNLGLLRFMDRSLFSFSHSSQQYVFLPELEFRGLLQTLEREETLVRELLKTPLISDELRPMTELELEYVEQYLWMGDTLRRRQWLCQMITPLGAHLLFQGLYQCLRFDRRWLLPAHSLFYQMKLGHHCRWTLQVTPPINKKMLGTWPFPVVERTLTRTFVDTRNKNHYKAAIVPVRDGGAGTNISNHRLSPSLKSALKFCLEMFHLTDIAKPFCSCELDVNEPLAYRPLNIKNIPFPQVTHVSFLSSSEPLHCWKRPSGFYISVSELVHKGHLPRDHCTVQTMLAAAVPEQDVCAMLEPEKLFLTQLRMDVTWRDVPTGAGRRPLVSQEEQQAAIIRFLEAQARLEEECRCSSGKDPRLREDLLVNLIYLRKVYRELAKADAAFHDHADAKFYIKMWPHICPLEDSASLCRLALQDLSTTSPHSDTRQRVAVEDRCLAGSSQTQQEPPACASDGTERVQGRERGTEDGGDIADLQECPPEVICHDEGMEGPPEVICHDEGMVDTAVNSTWDEEKWVVVGRSDPLTQHPQHSARSDRQEVKVEEPMEIIDLVESSDTDEEESDTDTAWKESLHQKESKESLQRPDKAAVIEEDHDHYAKHVQEMSRPSSQLVKHTKDIGTSTTNQESKPLGYTCHLFVNGKMVEGQSEFYEHKLNSKDGRCVRVIHKSEERKTQTGQEQQDSDSREVDESSRGVSQDRQGLKAGDDVQKDCVLNTARKVTRSTGSLSSRVRASHVTRDAGEMSDQSLASDSSLQSVPISQPVSHSIQTQPKTCVLKEEQSTGCRSIQVQFDADGESETDDDERGGTETDDDKAGGTDQSGAKEQDMKEARHEWDPSSQDLSMLSFKMDLYPRSCSCAEEVNDGILKPFSVVQCYWNLAKSTMVRLHQVGQAIVCGHVVFTFTHGGTLYLSLAQLQAVGVVQCGEEFNTHTSRVPRHWILEAGPTEIVFLTYCCFSDHVTDGAVDRALPYLISAELLCFLSFDKDVVRQRLRQSDIHLHRTGHICADSTTLAFDSKEQKWLKKVLKAWLKSMSLQDQLKELENRRMAGQLGDQVQHVCDGSSGGLPHLSSGREVKRHLQSASQSVARSMERFQDCAVYLRKIKTNELVMRPPPKGISVYVCSPNSSGGGSNIVKQKVVSVYGDQETVPSEGKCESTNVFEGAMLPKLFKEKTLCLKTGVGFRELNANNVSQWIGEKFSTHHLVLTGTLTLDLAKPRSAPPTLSCFRINDRLYVNWGELSVFLVGVETVFRLSRRLQVSFYNIPQALIIHLSRHLKGNAPVLATEPWLCVSSLNAMSWLGVLDRDCQTVFPRTIALMAAAFESTSRWKLQLRNFVLLPRDQCCSPAQCSLTGGALKSVG